MIGIVIVSHSRRLAEAAVELALQMVQGAPPPIEIAAGLDGGVLGTDATAVQAAIERVGSPEGVLVLMDLGSAVLSAELALELAGDSAPPIVLSEAPLVEGLVAAVVVAAAGAPLAEVAAEAASAGEIKAKLLGIGVPVLTDEGLARTTPPPSASVEVALHNAHGLHARPASRFVEAARRFDAEVGVRNVTLDGPVVSGRSVSALSTLGAVAGHHIEVQASGRQAREALAAIVALVRRNFDDVITVVPDAGPVASGPGPVGVSPGIGVGPKRSLELRPVDRVLELTPGRPADERNRLVTALAGTREELRIIRERVARATSEHNAAIFDAHLLLLDDDELVDAALGQIDERGVGAEQAWQHAVDAVADRFGSLTDPYLRARADDVRSVGQQVLAGLAGVEAIETSAAQGVVVVADLSPAAAAGLDPARVTAIVTAHGSPVSHGAILARALGIPMVVAAGTEVLAIQDGTTLVVDGSTGTVVVDPSADVVADYVDRARAEQRRADALLQAAAEPAVTIDGVSVQVAANIASSDDAAMAVRNGADSIGLLRSEFLFLDRREPPDEEEQVAAYLAIIDALGGRRLTVRTLDVGGDKSVPYLRREAEANPFLGCRGIRLSLVQPELFSAQLRALVRVGQQHPVSVLFPMVSTVGEVRDARRLLHEAATHVGLPTGELPLGFEVGVMVEVPSLALHAAAVAPLVDLFSIGTNDLTQYTLAAERGNAGVTALADPLDPAVLRLLAAVTAAAGDRARVAVCGELAADTAATALLVGLGVDELSVGSAAIPAVKDAIRGVEMPSALQLAAEALTLDSAGAVRALLG